MSNVCENSCPWVDYLAETINKFTYELFGSFSTTFGLTFNPNGIIVLGEEIVQEVLGFLNELVILLSFDDFQLQLLKVFLLTLISSVALIFVAWHIYGPRISEQFMKPNSPTEHCESSSG